MKSKRVCVWGGCLCRQHAMKRKGTARKTIRFCYDPPSITWASRTCGGCRWNVRLFCDSHRKGRLLDDMCDSRRLLIYYTIHSFDPQFRLESMITNLLCNRASPARSTSSEGERAFAFFEIPPPPQQALGPSHTTSSASTSQTMAPGASRSRRSSRSSSSSSWGMVVLLSTTLLLLSLGGAHARSKQVRRLSCVCVVCMRKRSILHTLDPHNPMRDRGSSLWLGLVRPRLIRDRSHQRIANVHHRTTHSRSVGKQPPWPDPLRPRPLTRHHRQEPCSSRPRRRRRR